jgi:hypothetical protein
VKAFVRRRPNWFYDPGRSTNPWVVYWFDVDYSPHFNVERFATFDEARIRALEVVFL